MRFARCDTSITDLRPPSKPMWKSSHRLVAGAVAILLLGACADFYSRENIIHDSHRHRIAGTENSVVVTNVDDQSHALPFAAQYCESRGKSARFDRMIQYKYSRHRMPVESAEFDCVSAGSPSPA